MGDDLSKSLGGIYDRLTKIETLMEEQRRTEQASSLGPRLQDLEIKYATMQGRMAGIGAVAGLAAGVIMKLI